MALRVATPLRTTLPEVGGAAQLEAHEQAWGEWLSALNSNASRLAPQLGPAVVVAEDGAWADARTQSGARSELVRVLVASIAGAGAALAVLGGLNLLVVALVVLSSAMAVAGMVGAVGLLMGWRLGMGLAIWMPLVSCCTVYRHAHLGYAFTQASAVSRRFPFPVYRLPPFNAGHLPLNCSGNPGVNGVSHRGVNGPRSG